MSGDTPSALAFLEQLVAEIRAATDAAAKAHAPAKTTPRFMTCERYAAHSGYSARQIRRFVKLGLPVTHAPGERWPRVIVAEADAWIARGGAERAIETRAQTASLRIVGKR